jgi:adenosylcobinamide kinase/adenosylcobinamide-phosphate guanylyltransferase
MGKTILITGGARSGKSGIAETMALSFGLPAVYVATATVGDEEMAARIAAHRARRGAEWITHAEPLDLPSVLKATDGHGPRLVDCLTLWLSNVIFAGRDWREEAQHLIDALYLQSGPVILVTNEVGSGIVPDNRLSRDFRDAAGIINQQVAAMADEVYLAVCGLPMKVK